MISAKGVQPLEKSDTYEHESRISIMERVDDTSVAMDFSVHPLNYVLLNNLLYSIN